MSLYETVPQDLALRLQLAVIEGGEPATSVIDVRHRPIGQAMRRDGFWPCRSHQAIAERVNTQAVAGDVFVSACPRARPEGNARAVGRGWCFWADIDQPDALDRIARFSPWPSMVLTTGTPGHALAMWALRHPLAPAWVVRANRRLANALDADQAATDAARIVRPAGSTNWKTGEPRPVVCVRLEPQVFDARDVVGPLPDPPAPPARQSAEPRQVPAGEDPLLSIPATEYVPALTGRELNRDGKVQCPWHAGGAERTPSLHAYPGDRGWYCWGCDAGGTIIDFGAQLYGLSPRGRDYHEIRRRLAADLLPHVRHAAA